MFKGEEALPAFYLHEKGAERRGKRGGKDSGFLLPPFQCWPHCPVPGLTRLHFSCAHLLHVTLNKYFIRNKGTLSCLSPVLPLPSWKLGGGQDTEKRALFLNLSHSSKTEKEKNRKESRNYCLFCFLFKHIKE